MKETRTTGAFRRLPPDAGLRPVLVLFAVWKALLLLIAIGSPGLGYDTSSSLLLDQAHHRSAGNGTSAMRTLPLLGKLVRWDAIYFVQIARRGYRFEQEWAFGPGFPGAVNLLSRVVERLGMQHPSWSPWTTRIAAAVGLAHLSHLLSVVFLYHLTLAVFPHGRGREVAFLTASLHVLSPAGPFLSAPYGEALFACLSFLGSWCYALSRTERPTWWGLGPHALVVLSGLVFGLSVTVRSNGILHGLLFLSDVVHHVGTSPTPWDRIFSRRTLALGLAGLSVLMGALIPQMAAYAPFCQTKGNPGLPRPWCTHTIPSIYTWVQVHYWNVGFLRYWTVSNLPLFLIAAPTLVILAASSIWALRIGWQGAPSVIDQRPSRPTRDRSTSEAAPPTRSDHDRTRWSLQRFAVPQLVLTVLAVSNYHVQIINRISSGYAIWYWWLAAAILDDRPITVAGRTWSVAPLAVRWMIMHALIQSVLFASFLPPA